MHHKRLRRPAYCTPGSMENREHEMAARIRLSRERLMASELTTRGTAWRLWASCVDQLEGFNREGDVTFAMALAKLAGIERQEASRLMRRFDELGIFQWLRPASPQKREASILLLPALPAGQVVKSLHVLPEKVSKPDGTGGETPPLQSNELSVEGVVVEGGDGACPAPGSTLHAPHSGAPDRSSEPWEAERPARPRAGPELQALAREELVRLAHARPEAHEAIRAELARRERFAPYGGDERTGDTTGDDEAAQVRWQGANPGKARRRTT